MPRNSLSWDRCDLCGRRTPTAECMVGGRSMKLCPYCYIALYSLGIVSTCRRLPLKIVLRAETARGGERRSPPRRTLMVDESIIETISVSKAGRRKKRKS